MLWIILRLEIVQDQGEFEGSFEQEEERWMILNNDRVYHFVAIWGKQFILWIILRLEIEQDHDMFEGSFEQEEERLMILNNDESIVLLSFEGNIECILVI